MALTITALSVSGLLAINYMIVRFRTNEFWSSMSRLIVTLSYVFFSLLVFYKSQTVPIAFGFIIIAQILVLITSSLAEKKDSDKFHDNYFIGSIIFFAASFVAHFMALMMFIGSSITLLPVLICAGAAIIISGITCMTCTLVKLDLRGLKFHTACFFFIANFLTALAVWYVFIVPQLLFYTISLAIIFVSHFVLLKVNFGSQKGKATAFIIHRSLHFIAQSFLLYFIYTDMLQFIVV